MELTIANLRKIGRGVSGGSQGKTGWGTGSGAAGGGASIAPTEDALRFDNTTGKKPQMQRIRIDIAPPLRADTAYRLRLRLRGSGTAALRAEDAVWKPRAGVALDAEAKGPQGFSASVWKPVSAETVATADGTTLELAFRTPLEHGRGPFLYLDARVPPGGVQTVDDLLLTADGDGK